MGQRRRQQIAGPFIKPGQDQGQHEQRDKPRDIQMNQTEKGADAQPSKTPMPLLFGKTKEDSPKKKLLGHRRDDNCKNTKVNLHSQRMRVRYQFHGSFVFNLPSHLLKKEDKNSFQ